MANTITKLRDRVYDSLRAVFPYAAVAASGTAYALTEAKNAAIATGISAGYLVNEWVDSGLRKLSPSMKKTRNLVLKPLSYVAFANIANAGANAAIKTASASSLESIASGQDQLILNTSPGNMSDLSEIANNVYTAVSNNFADTCRTVAEAFHTFPDTFNTDAETIIKYGIASIVALPVLKAVLSGANRVLNFIKEPAETYDKRQAKKALEQKLRQVNRE